MNSWWRGFPWVVALSLTAWTQSDTGGRNPRGGGTLRLAIESDQRTLDPVRIFSGHEGVFAALVHQSLLDYTADGRFTPSVARALPEVSADGRSLTFRLDPAARFANGRLVTADDVVNSLERCLDPTEGAMGAFFSNPVLDPLFQRAAVEPDAVARLRLYQRIEQGLVAEAPWIFLMHVNDDRILQPWVKGFQHRPIWPNSRFERCWLDR